MRAPRCASAVMALVIVAACGWSGVEAAAPEQGETPTAEEMAKCIAALHGATAAQDSKVVARGGYVRGQSARPVHVDRQGSSVRKLQEETTCNGGNANPDNTSCDGGAVLIAAANTTANGTASECCACPAGTTVAYADEALAFRFRAAEGITRDSDGALVWAAATPPGLAFVMNRTIVDGSTEEITMADSTNFYPNGGMIEEEPTVTNASDGSPSGLAFEYNYDSPTTGPAQMMYANRTIAVGAKHTLFAVVTPSANMIPSAYEALLGFRPWGFETGCFFWGFSNPSPSDASELRSLTANAWAWNYWKGAHTIQPAVPQVVVARSRYGIDPNGDPAPVVEFAVVDASAPSELVWVSTMVGDGMTQYSFDQAEEFDFDFRDPALDGQRVMGAGYMALGHQNPTTAYNLHSLFQLQGTVHHIELHSDTLSDAHVADLVHRIRHTLAHEAVELPTCRACPVGRYDEDHDSNTECQPCGLGTFSNQTGAIACTGTCLLGSTVVTAGASSSEACVQCAAGTYGNMASAHAVCEPCVPGRYSTLVGGIASESCLGCAPGRFSVAGSTVCEPSGCTDAWADNYNPLAVVDEGLCVYTCSVLRAHAGYDADEPGGCIMHNLAFGWQKHAHNGTVVGEGAGSVVDTPGEPSGVFPAGSAWVTQGRPLAGSTLQALLPIPWPVEPHMVSYSAHPSGFVAKHALVTSESSGSGSKAAVRYVTHGTWAFDNWTGAVNPGLDTPIRCSVGQAVIAEFLVLTHHQPYFVMHLSGSPPISVSDSVISDLVGDYTTGAVGATSFSSVTLTRTSLLRNQAEAGAGLTLLQSFGAVKNCAFVANVATKGAAICIDATSSATIVSSFFRDNVATELGGSAIAVENGGKLLALHHSVFVGGTAAISGKVLHLDRPATVDILNATFSPFEIGSDTVFLAGQLGGCEQHNCDAGDQCTYTNYSRFCSACPPGTVGLDGVRCTVCPPGKEPNQNNTGCVPCTGNSYSLYGVCMPCVGQANADRSRCQDCALYQIADPPELGCRCDDGYYNTSLMGGGGSTKMHICFWSGWDAEQQSTAIAKHNDWTLDCSACPSDAMLHPCLICEGSSSWIAPGFTAPPIANSEDGGSFVSVFRCHADIEIARKRCPGTAGSRRLAEAGSTVNLQCAEGYTGHICGECDDDWGMNTNRECEPCESGTSGTVGSIFILLGMIAGICIVLGITAKLWSDFPLKHLLRCSVQPMRILITYSQVTTQLGDVLNFQYPGLFGDVLDFLKPVLDIWGLLFRALGPSECFGVQGFTASWLLRVLGLPLIMSAIVMAIFLVERTRGSGSADDAAMNAKGNFFFVVFFCYPTICIISFAAFLCTPMTPDISVLDVDDTVRCEDSGHFTMQILSYIVIALVAVGLPCALLYVLTRMSATYERETQNSHLNTAKRIAVELDVDVQTTAFVIRDVTVGRDFSFVMDAYDPRYLYWEAVDMFRKLALVGLVLVVGRGTVAQLSIAIILAFGFFAAHVKCWPYKIHQDNLFRAATEVHVFIAIMAAQVMKNDLELETVQEGAYDWLLLLSFLVLIPLAFCVTVFSKVRFVISSLRDIDGDDAREKRRRAFDLHVLGLGSDEDKADLRRYVDGWLVKKDYAAFLSHFKLEAAAEARILKLELERGLRVPSEQIFLDADNLSDLRELLEQVQRSDVFILMLTDGVLSRPWCLAELDAAVKGGVHIVVVSINNAFRCDPAQIQKTLSTLPEYLAKKNPDALRQLISLKLNPSTMGSSILDAINTEDALTFDPNQSSVMMRAQIHQLATTMVDRACPENQQLLSFLDLTKVEPDPWVFTRKVAAYIVFAKGSTVVHELAAKVKAWLTLNGLAESQIELCTEADIAARDIDSVILLQTKQAIEDPRCLVHLFQASSISVPIVPIYLSSSAPEHAAMKYDFETAVSQLEGLQESLDPSERAELEKATGVSASKVGLGLAQSIPNIISKPLAIDSLESQFKAEMLDIELTLRRNLSSGHIMNSHVNSAVQKFACFKNVNKPQPQVATASMMAEEEEGEPPHNP